MATNKTALDVVVDKLNRLSGTSITKEQLYQSLQNSNPVEFNTFINDLFNRVLISGFWKRTIFSNPLSSLFIKQGTSISAHKEVLDSKLLESQDFDPTKRYADQQQKSRTIRTVLSTVIKKYIMNTLNYNIAKAAFVNDRSFSEWLNKQYEIITESFNIEIYDLLSKTIVKDTKNTIDFTSIKSVEGILKSITTIRDKMKFSTDAFNIGYVSKLNNNGEYELDTDITKNPDLTHTRKNAVNSERMVMILSPEMYNHLTASTKKIYHNKYFEIEKFDYVLIEQKYLKDADGKENILFLDKSSFQGYFRINEIATQQWAGNLTSEIYFHYWLVFGVIPWANGVKFKVSNINDIK